MMTPSYEAIDRLQLQSFAVEQRDQHLYAVIEGAKAPEGYKTTGALVYTLEEMPTVYPLFLSPDTEQNNTEWLDLSPWLVEVAPDSPLFEWLIENASCHPYILFWSPHPIGQVKPYLVNMLKTQSPAGNTLFFRYYDPAVFNMLIEHTPDDLICSRLGHVSAMATYNEYAPPTQSTWHLRQIGLAQQDHKLPLPVALTATEWQAIAELRRKISIRQLTGYLNRNYPDHLSGVEPDTLQQFVIGAIEQGESYGYKTQGELEQWLDLQLYFGDTLVGNPRYPWAKKIMDNKNLTATEKLNRLNLYLDQYQARSAE
ncbi:DUF4123 domain-containing protein [Alkalimarinus coralli]|uniref:DUF4123 domain-containing protein n=1 Tax=Alkalimarinus coralli TaxID=2935863 RepID=UPI00202B276F|nr:DUF4123 domain-containing protein [Alkalimarinus coralli]